MQGLVSDVLSSLSGEWRVNLETQVPRNDLYRSRTTMNEFRAHRWIKTDCGRAKYADLSTRRGLPAKLRLGWFVLIASLRDWSLPNPDALPDQEG